MSIENKFIKELRARWFWGIFEIIPFSTVAEQWWGSNTSQTILQHETEKLLILLPFWECRPSPCSGISTQNGTEPSDILGFHFFLCIRDISGIRARSQIFGKFLSGSKFCVEPLKQSFVWFRVLLCGRFCFPRKTQLKFNQWNLRNIP